MLPDVIVVNGQFRSGQNAGFLGSRHDPMTAGADPDGADFRPVDLGLGEAVESPRLRHRRALLARLEPSGRAGQAGAGGEFDEYHEKAFALLEAGLTRRAFAVDTEPGPVRERYGRNQFGQSVLLGRRLIEGGVRLVFVNAMPPPDGVGWDTHKDNFRSLKDQLLPPVDRALSALLEDLSARGLLDETLVVLVGEFGRTPKINDQAGRDHWSYVFSALLAGAGVPGGRLFGASDKHGALPADRPVTSGQLAATVFHALGVDPREKVPTLLGRPWQICDQEPVVDLWG
jgi:hypothetical protein